MSKNKKDRLGKRETLRAIAGVAMLSLRTAPLAAGFKAAGMLIDALLPIAITYYAAESATALAAAYTGAPGAGQAAITAIVATVGLGFVAIIWRSIDQYVQAYTRYRIEARVSDTMYERFLALEFWRYDDKTTADLYDRAKQFSSFFAYVLDRLAGIGSQAISVVLTLAALSVKVPWLAAAVAVAVLPGMYIQVRLARQQLAHWNSNVGVRRARSHIEWDLLQPGHIAELRLNGLVRHLLQLRRTLRDRDERTRLGYERASIGWRLLADALEAGTELAALLWTALQIIGRAQPVGQFIYVQQMVSRAISSANSFVHGLSTIDEDLGNLVDYQRFMQLPVAVGGTHQLSGPPGKIVFDDVSFRYPSAKRLTLRHLNFAITAGSHIAIVGENGAGKSTLIKLLCGLYQPTSGTIYLDDRPLNDIAVDSWHRQLAVLQQDFLQYQFASVRDNVVYGDVGRRQQSAQFKTAVAQAEATGFIAKLPHGDATTPSTWMEDDEGNAGINLSGGQWQRLALARSFYRDAPIVILDEPTSAIDALAEARIFRRLFARSNRRTLITISHRLSTVEKADSIIVLSDGRIVQTGTHAELIAQADGAYARLFAPSATEQG